MTSVKCVKSGNTINPLFNSQRIWYTNVHLSCSLTSSNIFKEGRDRRSGLQKTKREYKIQLPSSEDKQEGRSSVCSKAVPPSVVKLSLLCSAALGLPSKEPWLQASPVFTVSYGRTVGVGREVWEPGWGPGSVWEEFSCVLETKLWRLTWRWGCSGLDTSLCHGQKQWISWNLRGLGIQVPSVVSSMMFGWAR